MKKKKKFKCFFKIYVNKRISVKRGRGLEGINEIKLRKVIHTYKVIHTKKHMYYNYSILKNNLKRRKKKTARTQREREKETEEEEKEEEGWKEEGKKKETWQMDEKLSLITKCKSVKMSRITIYHKVRLTSLSRKIFHPIDSFVRIQI